MIEQRNVVSTIYANHLIDSYQTGSSFFFASPYHTLLTQGIYAKLPDTEERNHWKSLPGNVTNLLKQAKRSEQDIPLIVGAIPFDDTSPAHLIIPTTFGSAGPLHSETIVSVPQTDIPCNVRLVPEAQEYVGNVEAGLSLLRTEQLDKIVLARTLECTLPDVIDIPHLLHNLARYNPLSYVFAVDLGFDTPDIVQQHTLVGASPELLLSRTGSVVVANPLAGSIPRHSNPMEDHKRAQALLASVKDRHEHAIVVDSVARALRPFCDILDVPDEPSLIHTPTMWHLSSVVKGILADPATSSLVLATALHPTPAVCGHPTDAARDAINQIEPFDRGFFTGMVGWCNATGDGEWVVTIRCAEVKDQLLRLFAGAGIVIDSQAEEELAETTAKFRTMLNAMGLYQS